jgi:hypothetical protein
MAPYLLMLAVPSVFAVAGLRRTRVPLLVVALLYWLMIGFRYEVGTDWYNYRSLYLDLKRSGAAELVFRTEPGFSLLIWLAAETAGGLIFLNAASALLFCWGFFALAKSFREPFIAIAVATPLVAVASAMNLTRQGIAMGVIWYLFATWERRLLLSRLALVLVATLFHFSAVFILIFVALSARTTLVIRSAGAAAIAVLILLITNLAPTAMESYSRLYLSGKYQAPGAVAHVSVIAAAALFYFLFRKKWIQVNGENPLYLSLAAAGIIAIPAIYLSSVAAFRFALYLWPVPMYVCAGLPAMVDNAAGRAFSRVLLVAGSFLLLVAWLTFANNARAWLPYENWLL